MRRPLLFHRISFEPNWRNRRLLLPVLRIIPQESPSLLGNSSMVAMALKSSSPAWLQASPKKRSPSRSNTLWHCKTRRFVLKHDAWMQSRAERQVKLLQSVAT